MVIGLDPGPVKSALVTYDPGIKAVCDHITATNADVIAWLRWQYHAVALDCLVVEQIAAMGMAVGGEVFETCVWSGRFIEAWDSRGRTWHRLKRTPIKLHLCGTAKAKDPNVRRALMERFGGDCSVKKDGPLYGVKGDEWSALAVAVVWADQNVTNGALFERIG